MKNRTKIFLLHWLCETKKQRTFVLYQQNKWYIEEHSGNKYLTLFPTDKSKKALKKYEELWKEFNNII